MEKREKFKTKRFQNKNREKFQHQFKKHTPFWQQVEDEVKQLSARYENLNPSQIESFKDLPLSRRTMDGLKSASYLRPTEIQRQSICGALNGVDILGAAKTGSGKTLAFLIPILECLYRLKWAKLDGLGALIISPTRELAYQTFEVLKKVGYKHDFSAGLVIGGKVSSNDSIFFIF
jgi:ATP-dependent RNA helicase DDX10/DBP4